MHNNRTILPVIIGIVLMALLGTIPVTGATTSADTTSEITSPELAWITTPITNAATGEQFTIKELAEQGKPVIIHCFAVWCSGCSMQLLEATKLQTSYPGAYTVLALDIDPNEGAEKVKRHQQTNNFKGIFATAPTELTRSLVSAYGPGIIQSIPQTIIICNKSATYLEDGVFKADVLKKAADELCS